MWFLEIYYADGTEDLREYDSYAQLVTSRNILFHLFQEQVIKVVDYFSMGTIESSPLTHTP